MTTTFRPQSFDSQVYRRSSRAFACWATALILAAAAWSGLPRFAAGADAKAPAAQSSPSDRVPDAHPLAAASPSQPTAPSGPPACAPVAKAACQPCVEKTGCCQHVRRFGRARRCTCCCCCGCACGGGSATATTPAAAAAAPKADPFAWKDLFDAKTLKGWKKTKFGGEGNVEVKDGTIVMEMGNSMTGVTWDGGELPRDNYELSLEGMKLEGSDFFCTTTFPVGKDSCSLVVGGWGGTVVGLSTIDHYDASDNRTTTFHTFKDKQWYRVRIRVSESRIEAWLDDERVVNQERAGHKIGIRFECDLCQPLGIATYNTKGAARNIRVRPLSPEEIKAAAEEKKSEE